MHATIELQHEVEQRIGRNLLRYQLIELRLKHALPFRNVTLSNDGLKALQGEIDGIRKKTLGPLLNDYVDAFEHPTKEAREALRVLLVAYADARNWLAHHLLAESGGLQTNDACKACIERLDADYAKSEDLALQVREMVRFVRASVQTFTDAFSTAQSGIDGTIALGQRYAAEMVQRQGPGVTVEMQLSFQALLEEVMGNVERGRKHEGGWSSFEQVIFEIRQYREVPRRLLAAARRLGIYEFEQRTVEPSGPQVWMFRRISKTS